MRQRKKIGKMGLLFKYSGHQSPYWRNCILAKTVALLRKSMQVGEQQMQEPWADSCLVRCELEGNER